MADIKKLRYIVKFVLLCWVAVAVAIGVVVGLARILNNATQTLIVVQVVTYTCLFAFLGYQQYKWKVDTEKWKARNQNQNSGDAADADEPEEGNNGWK